MIRFHVRTLFGAWHLIALGAVAAAALLIPINSLDDLSRLRWLLTRTELFGPLLLMPMTAGLLLVNGKVDERQGVAPGGLGAQFLQRWMLITLYFGLALSLFLALAGERLGAGYELRVPIAAPALASAPAGGPPGTTILITSFSVLRTFPSAFITAVLFSLTGPLLHHATGSAPAGWAAGLGLYFGTLLIAMFWCPADSVYQIWLPFAGLSHAAPGALALSKTAYGLAAAGLLVLNLRILQKPERLIGRSE